MQGPTISGLRVRTPLDAQIIFHAVNLNILPMVNRRLDTEERRCIAPGSVYVWEERHPNVDSTGLGIERWTDSIRWGPSRVRDEFLFYHEKDMDQYDADVMTETPQTPTRFPSLIKQTYSVFVDTSRGRRKWHLIAYFTHDSVERLRTVDDIPDLARLTIPVGWYKSARSAKGRARETSNADRPASSRYSPTSVQVLAPLAYLRNMAPPRRDPMDEKALRSFAVTY
ncbi:hypothetical protein FISHEDRAFT_67466 [Fistulina hepatica ATCC 64428]|uniref:Gti1/Pac2 family-domain-containing protein n=1 Tax=Fistulina hepatica ATCC 64428 TaxID=1128425 RepID=A0A0D7A0L0_9AGAR|nr:hypothetical protein FISHEDRAFT_67466 [Fistulina hepatica ATCC 64428]